MNPPGMEPSDPYGTEDLFRRVMAHVTDQVWGAAGGRGSAGRQVRRPVPGQTAQRRLRLPAARLAPDDARTEAAITKILIYVNDNPLDASGRSSAATADSTAAWTTHEDARRVRDLATSRQRDSAFVYHCASALSSDGQSTAKQVLCELCLAFGHLPR
jgi:hypothetical protein